MKLVLGLDVGIASVGWGIIDKDSYQVIDSGVRLFAEGSSTLNEERRGRRSSRRLLRRRKHRIQRIRELLIQNKFIDEDFIPLNNPYEIRVKGLNNKLTNEELATAILNIAKKRGITGITLVDESETDEEKSTKRILSENNKLLQDKYVCEIQLERLKNGKLRGENNRFNTSDYIKELNKIFENQEVSQELQNKIIEIVKSKREYYDGPGSEKSPTIYGQFYLEDGKLIHVDMIEKMRGHCSIYPEELRAPKMCYTADLFNILNDLNNLKINGEHVTKEEKENIIKDYIDKKGSITIKQLEKFFGVDKELMSGLREDTKKNPIITEFKGYKKILKAIKENGLDIKIADDKKLVDNIIEVLTSKKGYEERVIALLELNLKEHEAKAFAKITGISGYHSLSLKVMNEVIPDLLNTTDNQMQIFQENGYFSKNLEKYVGNHIPFDNEAILSSVAKRSQKEALKITEAVIKKYGDLDSIVIEMPRDKNSEEERRRIREIQDRNKEINDRIKSLIGDKKVSNETKLKLRLYEQQHGKCIYTNNTINIDDLINDPYMYEIDHIIPISISFDDSLNNKVLVTHKANQDKGQRTPYAYFKSGEGDIDYATFKNIVLSLDLPRKKRSYLLYEKDLSKFENKKEFINRNLIDTQYAARVILNTLNNYFKANKKETKVFTIRGAVTNSFRKRAMIDKDRSEDYKHHAVDALIIAGVKSMKLYDNVLNIVRTEGSNFDAMTGEQITLANEENYFDAEYLKFIKGLRNLKTKYSHKIDSKPNRQMTDQTIYSTRKVEDTEYIVGKYKNIYDSDGVGLAKRLRDGKGDSLLMYRNDPDTYQILVDIVRNYPEEKNPFLAFYNETNDYIRKKSKKGKGPVIRSVKYLNKTLGTNMDISSKYNIKDKRVVLLSKTLYRLDFYEEDGLYKFLRVCHDNIKRKNDKYVIDREWYQCEKQRRKISEQAKFLFSLYKNDLFYYETIDEFSNNNEFCGNVVRCIGTDYNTNRVEYKNINNKLAGDRDSQTRLTIGKKIVRLEKRATDILGNMYKVNNEYCKFEL